MKKLIASVLVVAMLVSAFAGCTETGVDSEKALKISDTEYTVADFNTLFVMNFSSFFSYYGSYISNMMDLSKPLSEQDNGTGITWEEYFRDYTKNSLIDLTALYELAKEEGIELSEEDQTYLDGLADSVESDAKEYGTSVQEYITDMYGEGVTFSNIYRIMEIQSYAIAYQDYRQSQIELSDDDVMDFYESHRSDYDTADFRFTYIDYTTDAEEEGLTPEEAKAFSERFTEVTTVDEFKALCAELYPDQADDYLNEDSTSEYKGAHYTDLGIDEVAQWLFSPDREFGDIMVYDDREYNSYIAIMFESQNPYEYRLRNIRHILVKPEADEEGNSDEAAWDAAMEKAESILKEFQGGSINEESFAALAVAYSEDGGSGMNGGLYRNVSKGQMVTEFNDWLFDDARTEGETGIVKTSYGYHVMYYVGEGDSYVLTSLKSAASSEAYALWVDSVRETVEVTEYDGYLKVGNIIDGIYNRAVERAEQLAAEASGTDVAETAE